MNEALLAILASLVAALIWMVKSNAVRSDKLLAQRDTEVARAMDALTAAVDTFKTFEQDSSTAFGKLVDRLDGVEQIQDKTLRELEAMNAKLPTTP